jgi:hypothetical protein
LIILPGWQRISSRWAPYQEGKPSDAEPLTRTGTDQQTLSPLPGRERIRSLWAPYQEGNASAAAEPPTRKGTDHQTLSPLPRRERIRSLWAPYQEGKSSDAEPLTRMTTHQQTLSPLPVRERISRRWAPNQDDNPSAAAEPPSSMKSLKPRFPTRIRLHFIKRVLINELEKATQSCNYVNGSTWERPRKVEVNCWSDIYTSDKVSHQQSKKTRSSTFKTARAN